MNLPPGKLPPLLLAELAAELPSDPSVLLGPRHGEDAAVIDLGGPGRQVLVSKTDPITFATDAIGWYAVQVNANDVAAAGATPRWFMASILLPAAHATEQMARDIVGQIGDACRTLGVSVVGGHTEITHGIDRPIVAGCMLGIATPDAWVQTGGMEPGDHIILTKGAPLEAASIIAREKREELLKHVDPGVLQRCADYLYRPGISVVQDARIAMRVGGITSMHDPTEGGILTGLWEMAEASGCKVEIDLYGEQPVWLADAVKLCGLYGLDPAAAIASGALLVAIRPELVNALLQAYAAAEIPAYDIGAAATGTVGVIDRTRGLLTRPARDEITRLF